MIDKKELITVCKNLIEERLSNIQNAINGYKNDLLSESKSSAGDKHETGRAMLQLEMEKLGQQYQTVLSQKEILQKIEISPKLKAQVGSLICANGCYYFLATSIGQVKIQDKTIMVISAHSPIGKLLLGRQKGDSFVFNKKRFLVQEMI